MVPDRIRKKSMIVINQVACSPEFTAALAAVQAGTDVRMARWPDGMCLRKLGEQIVVIRDGQKIAPGWMGPSGAEAEASDWLVL